MKQSSPQQRLIQLLTHLRGKGLEGLTDMARWVLKQQRLAQVIEKLSMDKIHYFEVGRPDRITILLVGCGGTGGYAAQVIGQLGFWAKKAGLDLRIFFIDPDVVEEKNLGRQNFMWAELGKAKAFTLAWRYSVAHGILITPVVAPFSASMLDQYRPLVSFNGSLMIVVSAVDNFRARREIADAIEERLRGVMDYSSPHNKLVWIDAGNEQVTGQVVIGNSLEKEPLLSPFGFCVGIPLPHIQEPGLLVEPSRPDPDLSCAELTVLGEQSAMINRAMGDWIGVYLTRLLQTRDLTLMNTFVNLRTGATASKKIANGRMLPLKTSVQPVVAAVTPRRQPAEPADIPLADVFAEGIPQVCPVCMRQTIEGRDTYRGVLVRRVFCSECDWYMLTCPQCNAVVAEDIIEVGGVDVPTILCTECEWSSPVPADVLEREAALRETQPADAGQAEDEIPF